MGSASYEATDFGADKEVVVVLPESDLISDGDEITTLSISATGNASEFGAATLVASSVTAPDAPLLATPADNATDVSVSPLITWKTTTGADTYDIQVSTSEDFSATIIDESGVTNTEFQSATLSHSTVYFWRVRALNTAGQSDWSAVWSFTKEAEPL